MSWRYLVRRLAQVPFAVGAILAITFFLVHYVPGDPVTAIVGQDATVADMQQVRHHYGFDQPLGRQFLTYSGKVLHGDLGYSYARSQPVSRIIRDFAKPTLILTTTALALSVLGGVFLAVIAVRRPFGWLDRGINTSTLVAYSLPGFWLAQLAILYLVLRVRMFPLSGYAEFGGRAPSGVGHLADVAHHVMLPALVLAVTEVAALTRVLRSGLLGEMGQGYVRTAEAKGLTQDEVMSRHALRNAMLPIITVIGARIGFLLSGAAIVETIFVWPGLGSLLLSAIGRNDRPLILGVVLVASFAVVLANVLTDLMYRWVDPRIKYD